MAKTTNEATKGDQAKAAKAQPSLYQSIEAAAEDALTRGDHVVYSTLHPVVVSLAGAKFAASQAAHADVSDDERELLERIKTL